MQVKEKRPDSYRDHPAVPADLQPGRVFVTLVEEIEKVKVAADLQVCRCGAGLMPRLPAGRPPATVR